MKVKEFFLFIFCLFLIGNPWLVAFSSAENTIQFPSLDLPSPSPTPILPFQNQMPQPTITGIFPTMSPPIPTQTGPLIPTPQVVQTPQPVEIKPQIAWGKFNAYKEFGTGDKLLLGLDVDYPLNWKAQADVYNRIITFNEDPSGLVSFLVLPAWQGSWMDGYDFFNYISQGLYQKFTNLSLLNQESGSVPSQAIGVYPTFYKADLQGYIQEREMFIHVEIAVLRIEVTATSNLSYAGAVICYSPREIYQEKFQSYFGRMIRSVAKSMETIPTQNKQDG
jgi:hypothetical protein